MTSFANGEQSHKHSLETLEALYQYDEFMESIQTLADIGCGTGEDLRWWATRTTNEENPRPLNIKCTGIDVLPELPIAKEYPNITYQPVDFEETILTPGKSKFDVLWCHDSFQYCLNPTKTLSNWWHITSECGMLVIIVPQTSMLTKNQIGYYQHSGVYQHISMVSLIHMLATAGWDCRSGFFKKSPQDNWLHAVVYKSAIEPQNPRNLSWYTLAEQKLLPETAEKSVMAHGYLRQQDLVLPWLDQNLFWLAR